MRTKLSPLLFSLLGAAALLSGCASRWPDFAERNAPYDESQSYALNVMRQMYNTQLKDSPRPENLDTGSTLGTDVTLSTLAYLSGPRTYGGSFGMDLGMSLLKEFGRKKPGDLQTHFFAMVPVSKAPTRKTANMVVLKSTFEGLEAQARKMGYEVISWGEPEAVNILFQTKFRGGMTIINDKVGCTRAKSADEPNACWIAIWIPEISEKEYLPLPTPVWIDPKGEDAWRYHHLVNFDFRVQEKAAPNVDVAKIMADLAPGLPDMVWVYMPPERTGDDSWTAPYIASKKGIHLFIAPEGAKAE